ncbi:MAG TPA: methyltransferase domain-containing protein [Polyangiaceae bacterium]|nr:methyltransferase domain-containing protein [Polyangiaceae bacterium]
MSTPAGPVSALEYYEAFEQALSSLTRLRREYRRHFGASDRPAPPGYCWFKGVVSPERHPDYAEWACSAAAELEARFLSELPRLAPRSVLDVGCGNGALLLRLSEECPGAELRGVNFQPRQAAVARGLLQNTRAEIIEANFLELELGRRFELICMVESAFHMPDKAELCRRLAAALEPGGEVWLLDIVIAERASSAFTTLGRDQTLFNYVPLELWHSSFNPHGIQNVELVDLSREISDFLQVSDVNVLRDKYLQPRMSSTLCEASTLARTHGDPARLLELMVRTANEYRRLSRLLRGGMLQYVLMRWRKAG